MKPCVIFDLDGTLLDTLQDLCNAVNHTLEEFSYPKRTLEEIRSFVGSGVKNLLLRALPQECDEQTFDAFLASYISYYARHSADLTRPYPGVLDALEALCKEFPVAIASNKQDSAVKTLCRQFFGDIYAVGETADCPRKPAPDIILRTMEKLGCDTCVYVGDSEVDVITAEAAGVPCLSVLWGFRDKDALQSAGAKYFCDDAALLPQIIKEILYGK
jgi:phosphoglycolate phosphatase